MKLLQIALSVLLVLSPISCITAPKIAPDAVNSIKYGMEFSEVQKTLDTEGYIHLKWVEKGKIYFVIRYSMDTWNVYELVFRDDIFTAFIEQEDFNEAFEKQVVPPVDKLPLENGFEPLYVELVSEKYKFPQFEVYKVNKDLKDYKFPDNPSGVKSGVKDFLFASLLSPLWLPDFFIVSPFLLLDQKYQREFQNKFKKLSIGDSKETVIELLGQPEWSYNSTESDYEIFYYRGGSWGHGIGLRDGKLEWTFIEEEGNYSILYNQVTKFEKDKKMLEDNE